VLYEPLPLVVSRNPWWRAQMLRLETVVTRSPAPVLLAGPTGAGKSALARRIYELKRSLGLIGGGFIDVNCATLRGDHALSALFGHAKGAFTGAAAPREGYLREAEGGMLFLDEIGELGLDEQAMLLRAVEQKVFRPLGGDRDARSDFLLVCGTNRDLRGAVAAGRFREDLLARIGLWTFELPPLRDRLEDLEPNLDHELGRCAALLGLPVAMTPSARERYLAFGTSPSAVWRGNLRDLAASVERMATLAPGGQIAEREVEAEIAELRRAWATVSGELGDPLLTPRADARLGERAGDFDLFDRVQLEAVLAACARTPSLSAAGRLLFGASRRRLARINDAQRVHRLLARFGLSRPDLLEAE
jgi:transcriptional regulatory protein RtcR